MLNNLRRLVIPTLLSLIGTIIVLFPSNPDNMTLPSRDSGVFLYVGWRLLKGDIPYRDVWDHKPPLIYFVDALGLLLSPQSLVGVWRYHGSRPRCRGRSSVSAALKQRVDERRDGRALGEDHQAAENHHHDHDGHEPEFFARTQKLPELGHK